MLNPLGVRSESKIQLLFLFALWQKLTYPEFHFETETKADSVTGLQRYKGNYILNGYLRYTRVRCLGRQIVEGTSFNSKSEMIV